MIPALVAAAVTAAIAIAQGVATAASAKGQADFKAGEATKERAQREQLQREQLGQQQGQYNQQQEMGAQQRLQGTLQQSANATTGLAAERAQTRQDSGSALARAYLGAKGH